MHRWLRQLAVAATLTWAAMVGGSGAAVAQTKPEGEMTEQDKVFEAFTQASTETIHILYVPRHTALAATADTPSASANGSVPEEYHATLEAYAKWKACEAEDHRPSQFGRTFHDEWMAGLGQARADAKRKAGVQMPQVIVGRPRHTPAVGNGVDLR